MRAKQRIRGERFLTIVGASAGVVAAVAVLAGARVAGGNGVAGADVVFAANPVGELGVRPVGPFASGVGLMPDGRSISGRVTVANQTGRLLIVRVRALPNTKELNSVLRVQLRAGTRTLYAGSLEGLAQRGTAPFELARGQSRSLRLRAWLPSSLRHGFGGRTDAITFDWHVRHLGGNR
jgi:hypothetical protein